MKMLKLLALPVLAAILAPLAATARDLPEGYRRLTFIQGDPKQSTRILTNYTPNPRDDTFVVELEFTDLSVNQAIWCARNNFYQGNYSLFFLQTRMRMDIWWSSSSPDQGCETSYLENAVVTGQKIRFTVNKNNFAWKIGEGEEQQGSGAWWNDGYYSAWKSMMIFASYNIDYDSNLGNYGSYKLYSFKVYRGEELIHDFVPCRTDEGVVTLYDAVDSPATLTTYGTFKPGDEVLDSDFAATVEPQPFDGEHPCEPHPAITLVGETTVLTEGTDYTLTWSNNDRFGAATINVTGINAYAGKTGQISFRVVSPYGDGVVYYAKVGGDDAATCADWANAGSLSAAMAKAAASDGNAVALDDGTFDLSGCEPLDSGSFFETERLLTIVSRGGDPEKCVVLGGGADKPARFLAASGSGLTLLGVTLTNFQAMATSTSGGAVLCNASVAMTLNVSNCVFSGNAAYYGGAIHGGADNRLAKGLMVDCSFVADEARRSGTDQTMGGALYNFAGQIVGCRFERCKSTGHRGGAICGVPALISNCVFVANHAQRADHRYSGAVAGGGSFTFYNCVFSNNTSNSGNMIRGGDGSGAVHKLYDCQLFGNCQICGYSSVEYPDYLYLYRCKVFQNTGICGATASENCLYVGNGRNDQSWATLPYLGKGQFFNCTIVGTKSRLNGANGGVFGTGTKLTNCIVTKDNQVNATAGSYTYYATNCIWNASGKDLLVGEGNNTNLVDDAAIKFAGTGDDPYSIKLNSPARDKGVNVRGYTKADGDVIGNPRLSREGLLDIGCYEYQVTPGLMLLLR